MYGNVPRLLLEAFSGCPVLEKQPQDRLKSLNMKKNRIFGGFFLNFFKINQVLKKVDYNRYTWE
jgi:hypothetical protein